MTEVFRFDEWALWPGRRQLLRQGRPVALGGRAFDLLLALLEQPGRLVPKEELLERVWPGLAVEPNNLQVQVWTLRRLLGPGAIINVARRGYGFTPAVRVLPADPSSSSSPAAVAVAAAGWATALRAPPLVTLIGADAPRLRQAAEDLAAHRRAGTGGALWRVALPHPDVAAPALAWPDASDALWRRLSAAPGQLLLLDCQHAPGLARRLVQAARRTAPLLQLLVTAARPLALAGEVVVDMADLADPAHQAHQTHLAGSPGRTALARPAPAPALRWRARSGPSRG